MVAEQDSTLVRSEPFTQDCFEGKLIEKALLMGSHFP
jgi:hypothetical protein